MTRCATCGATLLAGATFCRSCGAAGSVTPAAEAPALGSARPHARRDAATLFALMPILLVAFVVMMQLARGLAWAPAMVAVPLVVALVALPIAFGLWRGARVARPIAFVVALGWLAFMVWAALQAAPHVASGNDPQLRSVYGWDLALALTQAALAAGALLVLLRKAA